MDFITELPESNGYDSILVIVDKLTKYATFIPTHSSVNEEATAKLFFEHIVSKYGIPRQIVSDRDSRWTGTFWKEVCRLMNMRRALTTAYHPQADGQTEIMNQILETALRSYVNPLRDDWHLLLSPFSLSYNTTPHSATTFSPSFLLFGFTPATIGSLLHPDSDHVPRPAAAEPGSPKNIARVNPPVPIPATSSKGMRSEASDPDATNHVTANSIEPRVSESFDASQFVLGFQTYRDQAKQALQFSQVAQQKTYNQGRLADEFDVGDKVLINPHSLRLLRSEKGRGKKLQMKYDGPFEISQKLGPTTYRLRMPASYGIHPILNIAHLERYASSDPEFGTRPTKLLNRDDFDTIPEFEVEAIVQDRWRKSRNGRKVQELLTRFTGYDASFDEWLTRRQLKNAPDVLRSWDLRQLPSDRGKTSLKVLVRS
jgi:hypothetical protein